MDLLISNTLTNNSTEVSKSTINVAQAKTANPKYASSTPTHINAKTSKSIESTNNQTSKAAKIVPSCTMMTTKASKRSDMDEDVQWWDPLDPFDPLFFDVYGIIPLD